MAELKPVKTPLTEQVLASALERGYLGAFNHEPSTDTLACGWAQVALENARGASVIQNNFGNITTWGKGGDYYTLTTKERPDPLRQPDVWKETVLKYKCYLNPAQGAQAYWQLFAGRYAPVLSCFSQGKPELAAYKLAELKYFTAKPGPYATAMRSLYNEFLKKLAPLFPASSAMADKGVSLITDEEIEKHLCLSAETVRDLAAVSVEPPSSSST